MANMFEINAMFNWGSNNLLEGQDIEQIDDIAHFTNLTSLSLTSLNLYSNKISDISPLSGLTNLTYLNLPNNRIRDISSLSGLANLIDLFLGHNYIVDISPLAKLTTLNALDLQINDISDLSPLSGLTNLTELNLGANAISDYTVIVAAGKKAGIGIEALAPVKKAMGNSLKTKTITLSCGKLTTGVTIKPWTGVFMLRNLKSPETYFQTAFRVQSPWTVYNPDGTSPNKEEIIKKTCYIFDFAPNRALKQIADYSCKLNTSEQNSEEKVKDFIQFLPILAYDGSSMKEIDASGVLDMAMSGTTATLLARRWESALLVNVTNDVLKKLLANPSAMEALMKIEGFRNLNTDLEIIINKSEAVKKAKKELAHKENVTKEETKALSNEEKEYTSKRKEIQDKLVKFATRIPVFMYFPDSTSTNQRSYLNLCNT